MRGLIDPLDDNYLREIAQHFAALDLPYSPLRSRTHRHRFWNTGASWSTTGTHPARSRPAPNATAQPERRPQRQGLLGLPRDYINGQLGGWRTGQRKATAPDCMGHVAKSLSNQDISAVSAGFQPRPCRAMASLR